MTDAAFNATPLQAITGLAAWCTAVPVVGTWLARLHSAEGPALLAAKRFPTTAADVDALNSFLIQALPVWPHNEAPPTPWALDPQALLAPLDPSGTGPSCLEALYQVGLLTEVGLSCLLRLGLPLRAIQRLPMPVPLPLWEPFHGGPVMSLYDVRDQVRAHPLHYVRWDANQPCLARIPNTLAPVVLGPFSRSHSELDYEDLLESWMTSMGQAILETAGPSARDRREAWSTVVAWPCETERSGASQALPHAFRPATRGEVVQVLDSYALTAGDEWVWLSPTAAWVAAHPNAVRARDAAGLRGLWSLLEQPRVDAGRLHTRVHRGLMSHAVARTLKVLDASSFPFQAVDEYTLCIALSERLIHTASVAQVAHSKSLIARGVGLHRMSMEAACQQTPQAYVMDACPLNPVIHALICGGHEAGPVREGLKECLTQLLTSARAHQWLTWLQDPESDASPVYALAAKAAKQRQGDGWQDALATLVAHGCDPNAGGEHGRPLYMYLAGQFEYDGEDDIQVAPWLAAGADPHGESGHRPLHEALRREWFEAAQLLWDAGARLTEERDLEGLPEDSRLWLKERFAQSAGMPTVAAPSRRARL